MKGYLEITRKLRKIKEMGYIKTHREGNTGIGKTLEDLLGIKENNIPGPNAKVIEIKSVRKNASSMLTLFTKSPLPKGANSVLLKRFGYYSEKNDKTKRLETTINAIKFNNLKGKKGFKITIESERINIITPENEIVGYWDKDTLKYAFEKKMPYLLYVKADSKGTGKGEQFWFNEAWLLSGFSFENFIKLLKEGIILVDIRIGQYPDGRTHDHGTGFRVMPDKLDLCFSNRERIM
ncbi:MAG: MvaI/BcnI family restriction endonuclease [candidate division WOR-3 bacterium]